ncbi:DUF3301 domain-containing protein [Uliginosibacterium gangwonense]|uniref:DUF3301 domain-containing protein n=1 Tax=Uliginosibacterium gangwonense TaxID=392736 RepID=UPI0004761215|nr:DUF3301 domain-containing protein [Uliginosibacterium gangwonense]
MNVIEPVVFLLGIAALVWYIADSLKAREYGVSAARNLCRKEGLQFLDDTVAQSGLRLVRNPDSGRLNIQRSFAFEYSDTGDNRRHGTITLLGQEVTLIYIGPRLVPTQAQIEQ